MSRKIKPPPKKPSKAYLVSFGDTMTALLAFFIVLNSFAKDQTGAQLHAGTGSFVKALKGNGAAGGSFGTKASSSYDRPAMTPIYAVQEKAPQDAQSNQSGRDDADDRVINRQAENFQRFLNEMSYRFDVTADPPTESQIVFDSFEKIGVDPNQPLGPNAIRLAADAITQLSSEEFELEIVVWATMPADFALRNATQDGLRIEQQILKSFAIPEQHQKRLTVSAQPWLFVDAARPKMSFVLSRIDLD